MNHLVTLGFVLLLAALVVGLDGSLALRAIDRLAQSERYTDIQNVMMSRTPLSGSEAERTAFGPRQCPLSGVKRTSHKRPRMSASDP
jgi:hypothetical protein